MEVTQTSGQIVIELKKNMKHIGSDLSGIRYRKKYAIPDKRQNVERIQSVASPMAATEERTKSEHQT
jgi:hypothetical protein